MLWGGSPFSKLFLRRKQRTTQCLLKSESLFSSGNEVWQTLFDLWNNLQTCTALIANIMDVVLFFHVCWKWVLTSLVSRGANWDTKKPYPEHGSEVLLAEDVPAFISCLFRVKASSGESQIAALCSAASPCHILVVLQD